MDAHPKHHEKKTYGRLLNLIDTQLMVESQRHNREALLRSRGNTAAPSLNARDPKGGGKRRSPSPAGRKKPGGKGGKRQSGGSAASSRRSSSRQSGSARPGSRPSSRNSRGSASSGGSSRNVGGGKCALFQVGKCTRGRSCKFAHETATAAERQELQSTIDRHLNGQKGGGKGGKSKGPCHMMQNTGTCKFGENCRYSHDVVPASPAIGDQRSPSRRTKKQKKKKKSRSRSSSAADGSSRQGGSGGSSRGRSRKRNKKGKKGNARSQTPGPGNAERPSSNEAQPQRGSSAEKPPEK